MSLEGAKRKFTRQLGDPEIGFISDQDAREAMDELADAWRSEMAGISLPTGGSPNDVLTWDGLQWQPQKPPTVVGGGGATLIHFGAAADRDDWSKWQCGQPGYAHGPVHAPPSPGDYFVDQDLGVVFEWSGTSFSAPLPAVEVAGVFTITSLVPAGGSELSNAPAYISLVPLDQHHAQPSVLSLV